MFPYVARKPVTCCAVACTSNRSLLPDRRSAVELAVTPRSDDQCAVGIEHQVTASPRQTPTGCPTVRLAGFDKSRRVLRGDLRGPAPPSSDGRPARVDDGDCGDFGRDRRDWLARR
jgi:hypothetical protein